MRKTIFWGTALVAVSLFVGLSAHTASAHSGRWYWSDERAEGKIYAWGPYGFMEKGDTIDGVNCKGYGSRIRSKEGPWFLYKHFICSISADVRNTGFCVGFCWYHVKLHVLGRYRFKLFLVWKERF